MKDIASNPPAAFISPPRKGEHNAAIDALRGIAAIMVVIYHMDSFGFPSVPGEVAVMGALGVNLFFTLSGFLIGRAVLNPTRFDRRNYLRNRSLRILPNYFICSLLMLFFIEPRTIAHASAGHLFFDLGAHAVLMHGWFGSISTSIIGPLWTLSHEWIFYLLIGAVAPLLRSRRGWMVPAGMFAVAIAAKYLLIARVWEPSAHGNNPLCKWDQFAMGIAGALVVFVSKEWKNHSIASWSAFVGGTLVLGGCLYRQYAFAYALHVTYLLEHAVPNARNFGMKFDNEFYRTRSAVVWFPCIFSLGVALLLVAFTTAFRRLDGWLKRTPLPWMGKVSYSTYLYHAAVLLCLSRGLHPSSADALFNDRRVATVFVFLGVYAISAFCYHFFEKPWLERKASPPTVQ